MLQVTRPIANELLAQYVTQGDALIQRASLVGDFSDYESWKAARNQWIAPTVQALEHVYGSSQEAREFKDAVTPAETDRRWQQQYATDLDCVKSAVAVLASLQSDLAIAREGDPSAPPATELAFGSAEQPGQAEPTQPREPPVEPYLSAEPAVEPYVSAEPVPSPLDAGELERPPPGGGEPAPSQIAAGELERQPLDAAKPAPSPPAAVELERPPLDAAKLAPSPIAAAKLPPTPGVSAELTSAANRSPLPDASSPDDLVARSGGAPAQSKRVFLAHGRNERWKQAVAELLEHAGSHEVTILNAPQKEQRPLVEQLEEQAAGPHYAIVLLTADDVGGPRLDTREEPYFSPRARQAVVFELGFLLAALTPSGVCVLYEDGVELPCEIDGLPYVRLDFAGTWQSKLLLRLRGAGFDYDLNKLAPV